MTAVALYPLPVYPVALVLLIQRLPEVDVLYGLAVSGLLAPLFPVQHPGGDAVPDVDRVSGQHHIAGLFEGSQPLYGGLQLHTIVGCISGAAVEFPLFTLVAQ
jgi:hypothetical protein